MLPQLPDGPLPVVDPISKSVVDVRPFMTMLYTKHNGDREQLADELHQLSHYLMREPGEQQDAATLRRMFNLVADLATALDSIKVIPMAS